MPIISLGLQRNKNGNLGNKEAVGKNVAISLAAGLKNPIDTVVKLVKK